MKSLLNKLLEIDVAKMIPSMSSFLGWTKFLLFVAILVGPVIMTVSGAKYYYKPEESPESGRGYRTPRSIKTHTAWDFTQRFAGKILGLAGAALTLLTLIAGIISLFGSAMTMATVAVICLVLELGATVALRIYIDKTVEKHYDANGRKIRNTK